MSVERAFTKPALHEVSESGAGLFVPEVVIGHDPLRPFHEQAALRLASFLPTTIDGKKMISHGGHLNKKGRETADSLTIQLREALWVGNGPANETQAYTAYSRNLSKTYAYIRDQQKAGNEQFADVDLALLRRICTSSRHSFTSRRYEKKQVAPTVVFETQKAPVREVLPGLTMPDRLTTTFGASAFIALGLLGWEIAHANQPAIPLPPRQIVTQSPLEVPSAMRIMIPGGENKPIAMKVATETAATAAVRPLLNFGVGEKVTLTLPDSAGKPFYTTFVIREERSVDDLSTLGGVAFTRDPNEVIKIVDNKEHPTKTLLLCHSDKGACQKLRDVARDENFIGAEGTTTSNAGITSVRIADSHIVNRGEGESIEELMANLPPGTYIDSCDTYHGQVQIGDKVVTTNSWRIVQIEPTPKPQVSTSVSRRLKTYMEQGRKHLQKAREMAKSRVAEVISRTRGF